jgi:hypothetical protein
MVHSGGKSILVVVAVLALIALLSGCGGGEDGATASDGAIATSSLTKAAYMKRVKAICTDIFSEVTREYEAFYEAKKRTATELDEKAGEVLTPHVAKLEKQMKALGAPSGQEQKIEKIVVALKAGIKRAEEDIRTTRGAYGEFAFERAYDLMLAYGFEGCWLD